MCEKDNIWNPATCSCENGKHLTSIIDKSVIRWDDIMKETKITFTESNSKTFYILLAFSINYHSIIDSCTQPAWDVSERSQSDLYLERHLKNILETSQKRWILWQP